MMPKDRLLLKAEMVPGYRMVGPVTLALVPLTHPVLAQSSSQSLACPSGGGKKVDIFPTADGLLRGVSPRLLHHFFFLFLSSFPDIFEIGSHVD